jgi:hypothetical protein
MEDAMPMDFPDMQSLKDAAEVHKFRQPTKGETEADFRSALADHVKLRDFVESEEIRTGHGWDMFTSSEEQAAARRAILRSNYPTWPPHRSTED